MSIYLIRLTDAILVIAPTFPVQLYSIHTDEHVIKEKYCNAEIKSNQYCH